VELQAERSPCSRIAEEGILGVKMGLILLVDAAAADNDDKLNAVNYHILCVLQP
jgi:hypothetical protein